MPRLPAAAAHALLALLFAAGPLLAQDPPEIGPEPGIAPDTGFVRSSELTPGGAFLRGLLLPGWGHIAAGSHGRGGFYVAAQSGTLWMLTKSTLRRRQANRFLELEREAAASRIRSTGEFDPGTLLFEIDQDSQVSELIELRDSRSQQVEDWAALGIFLVLLSAVDAFVAAHLMDYPAPLSLDVLPSASGSGMDLRFRVPVRGR